MGDLPPTFKLLVRQIATTMRKNPLHSGWIPAVLVGMIMLALGAGCTPDDYVAPWPQNTTEPGGYDETPNTGPLRVRASGHDAWYRSWHQPYYGGRVSVIFTVGSYTTVQEYRGWTDSTIFTGIYLGSQAMRYHVTEDPTARDNAVRMVSTLSGHLHVTGTPGYIARYRAPQTALPYPGDELCDIHERCFQVEDGPFSGDFWWGSTSRDQFIGWMFGMTMAYDLVDDEPMREIIRADMLEVVGQLIDNDWTIIAQDGNPTGTAPYIGPMTQLSFCIQAYHVTGDERILLELKKRLRNMQRAEHKISTAFKLFNRYYEYFGNNLAHLNMYQLLRLGSYYFSEEDHAWFVQLFNEAIHTFTRLSHNAWFNAVFMSQGGWTQAEEDDPYLTQFLGDLTDFPDAPNSRTFVPQRDPATYVLDPVSQDLVEMVEHLPILEELLGITCELQALEAFPVPLQCPDHFQWERNPFRIRECSWNEPRDVGPGGDYLIAYWTGRYHRLIGKDR